RWSVRRTRLMRQRLVQRERQARVLGRSLSLESRQASERVRGHPLLELLRRRPSELLLVRQPFRPPGGPAALGTGVGPSFCLAGTQGRRTRSSVRGRGSRLAKGEARG